jgi:hypothetical protein
VGCISRTSRRPLSEVTNLPDIGLSSNSVSDTGVHDESKDDEECEDDNEEDEEDLLTFPEFFQLDNNHLEWCDFRVTSPFVMSRLSNLEGSMDSNDICRY